MKKFLKTALQTVFVIAVFVFLSRSLIYNWNRIEVDFEKVNYFYLSLSLICFTLAWIVAALAWGHITKHLKKPLNSKDSVKIWVWSQSARYLPGSVWQVIGRINMSQKKGIKKGLTLASIAIETSNLIISSLIVFTLSLPFWPKLSGLTAYTPFLIAGFSIFGFLHPKVFNWATSFFIRRLDKEEALKNYSFADILTMLAPYLLVWVIFGVAFFLLGISFNVSKLSFLPVAIGTFALSWVIGFLFVIAPGGLGARELALVYFLGFFMSNPLAVLLAIFSRVLMIIGELFLLAASAFWRE